ncbi:hypothetical protein AWZ03_005361 [Drosophila navojoa]|uniref:VM domain-containing protein n=1 Tax=Drosophila navojoa TaxID=7232 RepID=A0A484BH44_DRONA|nr:kininogen-1 [Drosophila navojoa]TDG48186.1 hypothetical protein AWZ03_005361 [Drosophila navojoa]
MSLLGSISCLMLLTVWSLQQMLLLQAAPGIDNAAYINQDLWAEESAPAEVAAAVKRPRRYDVDGSVHCGRHGRHWPGHGFGQGYGHGYEPGYGFGYWTGFGFGYGHGHDRGHGHGRGYGHGNGNGYGPGYGPSFGFGLTGFGNDDNHQGEPQYKVPLAPFIENERESAELPSSTSSLAPPTSRQTTAAPATTAATTTEDSTLAIDLRSGLS